MLCLAGSMTKDLRLYRIKATQGERSYDCMAASMEEAMGHFRAARDIGFDNIEVTDDSKRNYDEISMSKILVARHRASTTTRLSIDVKKKDAASLFVDRFRSAAGEFIVCAEKLNDGLFDLSPQYTLLFHAVELGLKAFLAQHGIDKRVLKNEYGHDLIKLYQAARSRGMTLAAVDNVDRDILWINEWHGAGASIRYEFDEQRTLPICETLFPLARAILNASR